MGSIAMFLKFKKISLLAVLLVYLGGCVTSDSSGNDFNRYVVWLKEQEALFEPYMGKTGHDIEMIFGVPQKKYKPSNPLETPYDEGWIYGPLNIGEAKGYHLLFKENRFIKVIVV